MFDVLDENQAFTGETISREAAHQAGAWHRAVSLYVVNGKNQVLLQRRSADKKLWPNCWDHAAGGHVEAGELGLACVIKETEEELGIKLKASDIRYASGLRSDRHHGKVWDRHFNECYIAFKDIDLKDVKVQDSEVAEIKWVDYSVFKKMVEQNDKSLTDKESHGAFIRYMDRYQNKL